MKLIENHLTHLEKIIDIEKYLPASNIHTVENLRLTIASTVIENFLRFPTLFFLQLDFSRINGNRQDKKKFVVSPLVIGGKSFPQLRDDYITRQYKSNFYQFVSSDKNTYGKILSNDNKEYELQDIRETIQESFNYLNNHISLLQTMKLDFPIFNLQRVSREGNLGETFHEQIKELIGQEGLTLLNYYLLEEKLVEKNVPFKAHKI